MFGFVAPTLQSRLRLGGKTQAHKDVWGGQVSTWPRRSHAGRDGTASDIRQTAYFSLAALNLAILRPAANL
jgi:hypothetical protein